MPMPMPMTQTYDHDFRDLSDADRGIALDALAEDLRSPDPVVRDEDAYLAAVRWIPALRPGERVRLGDRMTVHLKDPAVQARSFAPLVLARIVDAGGWQPRWWDAFAQWYPSETDLRSYDPRLGWVHAVAHGADLLAALARHAGQWSRPLADLAVARLLAPTDHLFDAQEDDRLAYALAQILSNSALTEADSTHWLTPVAAAFRTGEPGPVPPWASNTMRTLRMLYVLADRGSSRRNTDEPARPLTHRAAVLAELARTLALVAPCTG